MDNITKEMVQVADYMIEHNTCEGDYLDGMSACINCPTKLGIDSPLLPCEDKEGVHWGIGANMSKRAAQWKEDNKEEIYNLFTSQASFVIPPDSHLATHIDPNAHYHEGNIEPIDFFELVIKEMGDEVTSIEAGSVLNILKYSMRAGKKDAVEKEARKVAMYLKRYKTGRWLNESTKG